MCQLKKLHFYSSLHQEWRTNLRIVDTCPSSKYFNFIKEWNCNIQHVLQKIKYCSCLWYLVFCPCWIFNNGFSIVLHSYYYSLPFMKSGYNFIWLTGFLSLLSGDSLLWITWSCWGHVENKEKKGNFLCI